MRILIEAGRGCGTHGVLRLRRVGRLAAHSATVRMTVAKAALLICGLVWCGTAFAANYYVSSSSGSDGNPGTQAQPFQTLAKVNGLSLSPGDSVFFKRGDIWNEQLIPAASGTSAIPITYDAYGTGAAPLFTPTMSLAGATWTHNSGNIYTTTLTTAIGSPQINNVQLGNIWGRKRTATPGCTSAGVIQGYGDFCVVYPTLYLYSPNGTAPPSYYGLISVVVGQPSGLAVISVTNKSWLVFQHIKVQNFDYIGVSVSGTSDNVIFANMESDGIVPYGTTPHGFYVNAASASNIQFLNDDAHLNYDGFHIDAANAVTITNCRGYANRDAGLKDDSGHATYSYSHFYGNNVAQLLTADVVGAVAGTGNISSLVAPVVANFNTYSARFSFTVDDVGSAPGTEDYVNTLTAVFAGHGTKGDKFNVAVVPSYAVDWASVKNWYAAGNEIDSHSWSHQYYTTTSVPQGTCTLATCPNSPALSLQYTGSGTAAALSISGNILTTTVTGASGDNLSLNLANAPYNTRQGLRAYLGSLAHYAVSDPSSPIARPNTKTVNLLNVSNQDIKSAALALVYDQAKLLPDEMSSSKAAIEANVPGLMETFFVYPDGIQDPTSEADAIAAGYTAARGSLAMKGQDNCTATANSVYANGVNVQNITSLAAISIHDMTQRQINQIAQSLAFRAAAWGIPYGIFTHYNTRGDNTPDISNVELGYLLDAVTANGGVWMTNGAMASAVTAGTAIGGGTRYVQSPTGSQVSLAVAGANSPTVSRGTQTAYPVDLNGTSRSGLGTWDVGASAYLSQRYGTGLGAGSTYIGLIPTQTPTIAFSTDILGNTHAEITNPNGDRSVSCVTLDGSNPASNGDGKTCENGFVSLSAALGGGHFALNQSVTVKISAGVAGGLDSGTNTYTVSIPHQVILAQNFSWQCGTGTNAPNGCGLSSSPYVQLPTSAAMPVVYRLHDTGTNWASMEPGSGGNYSWTSLDRIVDAVAANHPSWIIVNQQTETPCEYQQTGVGQCGNLAVYPNGTNSPPNDLGPHPECAPFAVCSPKFNAYISAFVNHTTAGGHRIKDWIKVHQLYNEWDIAAHWVGSMQQVYQLVAPAAAIIRAAIPDAVLLSPSATPYSNTGLGYEADWQDWLDYENANGRISDYLDWHDYLTSTNTTIHSPEWAWTHTGADYVNIINNTSGWQYSPWVNGETNFNGAPAPGLNYTCPWSATPAPPMTFSETDCAGMIARWQILHSSNGADGLYWYKGQQTLVATEPGSPISYQAVYQNLQAVLVGGYFTAGASSNGLNPATWSSSFVESNGTQGLWLWTDSESGVSYTIPTGYYEYKDLLGGTTAIAEGQSITLSVMPILLESCGPPNYACSSTSLSTITYPPAAPNVGGLTGAGTVFTDPLCSILGGNCIPTKGVRLTDANFDPSYAGNNANVYIPGNGSGAEDIGWSIDDNLTFVTSSGGRHYLLGFNPDTMALSRPYATARAGCPLNSGDCTKTGGWAGPGPWAFSSADPCKLYMISDTQMISYTFGSDVVPWSNMCSSSISGPPSPVTVVDFSTLSPPGCVGSACNALPSDFGSVSWTDNPETVVGDAIFGEGVSSAKYHYEDAAWQASTAYVLSAHVQPTNNNPSYYSFKATSGTSGTTEPNWNTSCPNKNDTCTDGTITWTNLGLIASQNTGILAVVWSPTKGYMSYNTLSGRINADIGWAGGAGLTCGSTQCTGTSTLSAAFTLHNIKFNKDGSRLMLATGGWVTGGCSSSNPPIWVIGTTTVYCSEDSTYTTGHWALGTKGLVNASGPNVYSMAYRTMGETGPGTPVLINTLPSPPCTVGEDVHVGWQNADANDTTPISMTRTTSTMGTTGLMPFDAVPCAWVNELDMVDTNGAGFTHREALTFNTAYSVGFATQNSISTCSNDGKFCSVGSDWFNIRNAGGTSTSCIPNGPNWLASKSYPQNYIVNPTTNNAANNSFKATAGGTAGTTQPNWGASCTTTCTDGGVTWMNIGAPSGTNQCGWDAFAWKLK